MPKRSAVLDTNIFISSLLAPNSYLAQIIEIYKRNYFQLIISYPILQELEEVLSRPKYSTIYHISQTDKLNLITSIKTHAEIIQKLNKPKTTLRDQEDLIILATAIDGKANYLVTGDKDLLVLNKTFKHLQIITPRVFLSNFTSSDEQLEAYLEEREGL